MKVKEHPQITQITQIQKLDRDVEWSKLLNVPA
jgi:hypothetical protein